MSIPESIHIRVLSDGVPAEGVLVEAIIRVRRKNDFASIHGPSDREGRVLITKDKILHEAESDRSMFQMDYGHPEDDFAGVISLQPCGESILHRALNGYLEFSKYCPYPLGYEQMLHEALARLNTQRWNILTLHMLEAEGAARVELNSVTAKS